MVLSRVWSFLRAGLRKTTTSFSALAFHKAPRAVPQVIIVVEGQNDIEFLRRMSAILHATDPRLPDLGEMERQREIVFVPAGGGDARSWAWRLAGLAPAEFHLLDRDVSPATEARREAAEIVNRRPHCRAVLTSFRSMENYLHPDAIFEASGLRVEFSGDDHVADLVARRAYERQERLIAWESLPARTRKRRRDKAKAWLNTRAVDRMTPDRLTECDPAGDVRSWLETIARLAEGGR